MAIYALVHTYTVEPLYSGHPWGSLKSPDQRRCPHFRGCLIHFSMYIVGTMHGVLIKGDVLISGVSLQRGSTVYLSALPPPPIHTQHNIGSRESSRAETTVVGTTGYCSPRHYWVSTTYMTLYQYLYSGKFSRVIRFRRQAIFTIIKFHGCTRSFPLCLYNHIYLTSILAIITKIHVK